MTVNELIKKLQELLPDHKNTRVVATSGDIERIYVGSEYGYEIDNDENHLVQETIIYVR